MQILRLDQVKRFIMVLRKGLNLLITQYYLLRILINTLNSFLFMYLLNQVISGGKREQCTDAILNNGMS